MAKLFVNLLKELMDQRIKIKSLLQLYEQIPESERIMVDLLRLIIRDKLKGYVKEKISYNVPFFYGQKGICIIWPSSIPRGGIKKGVLLGFWYGNHLSDLDNYLISGNNKRIYYRIFQKVDEIKIAPIARLLKEALATDRHWASK